MKIIDVINGIKTLDIPYAYDHFKDEQTPPYCAYRYVESDNFHADDKAYFKKGKFDVELYVAKKNPSLEKSFEAIFDNGNAPYRKYESYIEEIELYLVLWELETEEDYGE